MPTTIEASFRNQRYQTLQWEGKEDKTDMQEKITSY